MQMLGLGQVRLLAVIFSDLFINIRVDVPLKAHRICQADSGSFVGVISL